MGFSVPAMFRSRILLSIDSLMVPGWSDNLPLGKKTGINLVLEYSSIRKNERPEVTSPIRKALKKCVPFLFAYENRMLNQEKKENRPNFWQERLPARTFVAMQRASGFHRFTVKPLIIRPPIFMRGKSEIPLVPPLLEKPLLGCFRILNRAFGHHPFFTFLAESYMVVGEKR